MDGKRDPRVDPRPGDVLRRGKELRKVMHLIGKEVLCERSLDAADYETYVSPWLSQWRRWAKDAEILEVANGK